MDSPRSVVDAEVELDDPIELNTDASESSDGLPASQIPLAVMRRLRLTMQTYRQLRRTRTNAMFADYESRLNSLHEETHGRSERPALSAQQTNALRTQILLAVTAHHQAGIDELFALRAEIRALEREERATTSAQPIAEGEARIGRQRAVHTGLAWSCVDASPRDILCVGLLKEAVIEEVAMSDIPGDQPICPIDYEPYARPVRTTQCGHMFCAACISQWLLQSHTCPFCRREIFLHHNEWHVDDSESDSDDSDSDFEPDDDGDSDEVADSDGYGDLDGDEDSEDDGEISDEDGEDSDFTVDWADDEDFDDSEDPRIVSDAGSDLADDASHHHSQEQLCASDESENPDDGIERCMEESEDDADEDENDVEESESYTEEGDDSSNSSDYITADESPCGNVSGSTSDSHIYGDLGSSDETENEAQESENQNYPDQISETAVDEGDYYLHERLPSYLVEHGWE